MPAGGVAPSAGGVAGDVGADFHNQFGLQISVPSPVASTLCGLRPQMPSPCGSFDLTGLCPAAQGGA